VLPASPTKALAAQTSRAASDAGDGSSGLAGGMKYEDIVPIVICPLSDAGISAVPEKPPDTLILTISYKTGACFIPALVCPLS
jgi:hypothetical protein